MEEKNPSQQEETGVPQEEKQVKTPWQQQKESWYDKIPLSLKQLVRKKHVLKVRLLPKV